MNKYHEYLSINYWVDYISDNKLLYICPIYRFERMMVEINDLKKDIDRLEQEVFELKTGNIDYASYMENEFRKKRERNES